MPRTIKLALSFVVCIVFGFAAGLLVSMEHLKVHSGHARNQVYAANKERDAVLARAQQAERDRDEAKNALEKAVAELTAARERATELERRAPAGGHAEGESGELEGASLSDQETQAKLMELSGAVEKAAASKDGKALLKALQELVALGEVAYPRVVEGLGLLFQDLFGENSLKLVVTDVFMSISGKKWDAYYKWTLKTPSVDPDARKGAVEALIWSRDPGVGSFLAAQLATEKDRAVAKAIMDNLAWKDPDAKLAIRDVLATRRDDKQIRMDAVNALWSIGDEMAMQALTSAAQGDSDPDVREAARIASRGIDPPVAGYMVNYINAEAGGSPLQRGDIVLAYNGKPISGGDSLGKESRGTDGLAEVPIQIYRNGEVVNLTVRGGSIDAWGRYVKPKK